MSETPSKIVLTLNGDNLSYTAEIEPLVATQIISICMSGVSQPPLIPQLEHLRSSNLSIQIDAQTSPAEFLNQYGPKRNPDKILALAVYLADHDSKKKFNPGEINRLFRDAGEITPANFTRDFKWAISSGWIARDTAEKNSYYVTNSGRKILEQGFPSELIKKSSQSKSGLVRRSKRKNATQKAN